MPSHVLSGVLGRSIALSLGCSYRVMPATVGDRLKVFWRVGRWLATPKAI